jgi:hypothetical protein
MFDFLSDIFNFIGDILNAIWEFIKEYWLIIVIAVIIVLAIFFPAILLAVWQWISTVGWPWLVEAASGVATFVAGLGLEGAVALALGAAILIDPEGVGEGIGNIAEGVGEAAGSILSSPMGLLALGGAALFILSSSGSDNTPVVIDGRS